jgi:hypothetical protein
LAGKQVSAVKHLGMGMDEFVQYIERQWQPGMGWHNYGIGPDQWSIDHRVPLLGKQHGIDLLKASHQRAACHYSNLMPLWHGDNLRKGNREVAPEAMDNFWLLVDRFEQEATQCFFTDTKPA